MTLFSFSMLLWQLSVLKCLLFRFRMKMKQSVLQDIQYIIQIFKILFGYWFLKKLRLLRVKICFIKRTFCKNPTEFMVELAFVKIQIHKYSNKWLETSIMNDKAVEYLCIFVSLIPDKMSRNWKYKVIFSRFVFV